MHWQGADHGREGLLSSDNWFEVLKVLARHEGENIRDVTSPVYGDLYETLPGTTWIGANNRPFFRDYPKPWTAPGAIQPNEDTDGILTLTPAGRRLLDEPHSLTEFFRQYLDHYLEDWNIDGAHFTVSPFELIALALTSLPNGITVTELQKQSEDLAAMWLSKGDDALFDNDDPTSRRRFRSYLILLENAAAIERRPNGEVLVMDDEYIRQMISQEHLVGLGRVSMETSVDFDTDTRRRSSSSRVVREAQEEFATALRDAYGNRCCVTGTGVAEVLEGAHIVPYMGRASSTVRNGLLLAVDIHRLFDRNLLAIHPESLTVELAPRLSDGRYSQYQNRAIALPTNANQFPDRQALDRKFQLFLSSHPS